MMLITTSVRNGNSTLEDLHNQALKELRPMQLAGPTGETILITKERYMELLTKAGER